jgi:hypothetical protein
VNRHYSSSNVVNWLRDRVFRIEKPTALSWGQWDVWEDELKKSKPVAYFFTEVLPDWIEYIPKYTIDYVYDAIYYIRNRLEGSHRLSSELKKGTYHELSSRLLHSCFDSYVEFIEVEEANMHVAFSSKEDREKYNVPWWRWNRLFRIKTWRNEQAAIDHLKWEMTLDKPNPNDPNHQLSEHQAISAREKMALYTWWKHIRPARGDAWDDSGFGAFWIEMDKLHGEDWLGLGGKGKMTPAQKRKYDKLCKIKDDLDVQREQEDEDMLIRLIKIRKSLWT